MEKEFKKETQKEESEKPEYITVLYRVEDHNEWVKTNPLSYRHNGLQVVRVSAYDAFERIESLERIQENNDA